jgi:AraC-like DNA-binding protein
VGLGLSIARRLVALHGGLMTVDSYLGKGSTFHIYLPLPNLMNTPLAATSNTQAVLLVVSARPTISPEILTYCQQQGLISYRVANYDDLERALVDGLPRAIAWDADHASETEESVIHRLRTNPQLCTLPFLLYRSPAAPITSMLLKPVKPETLLSIISSLFNAGNSSRTILVVDDDETTLTLYQNLLSENFPEFICRTASNGQEALAISSDHIPYLVILDLMMPECDGFEVIRQLRADRRTQDVPIAVLSGKILSLEDIKRLEPYSKVTFQNKDMLSDAEFISSLQQVLFDRHVFHPQTSAAVKHAVAYIQQHYAESVSRSEIAQAVGVSENYLTHIFHQELGISLWDYLNRYRILQAKELLLYTHDSIAHISTLVGFDDPAYFSRVFRRYVGQSPRVYRSNTPE